MPKMTATRELRVTTTQGHTISFRKGEQTQVPDDLAVIEACRSQGATFVDDSDAPENTPPVLVNLPKDNEERKARIVALFKEMQAHQMEHRDHFTAFGRPNTRWVSQTLGFDIAAKEIETLWLELTHPTGL